MSQYVVNPLTGRTIRKEGRAYKRWRRAHPTEPEPPVVVDNPRLRWTPPVHHERTPSTSSYPTPVTMNSSCPRTFPTEDPNPFSRSPPETNLSCMLEDPRPAQPHACCSRGASSSPGHVPSVWPEPPVDAWYPRHRLGNRHPAGTCPHHANFAPRMIPHTPAPPIRGVHRNPPGKRGVAGAPATPWSPRSMGLEPHSECGDDSTGRSYECCSGNCHETTRDDAQVILRLLREQGPTLLQAYKDPQVDFLRVLSNTFHRHAPVVGHRDD